MRILRGHASSNGGHILPGHGAISNPTVESFFSGDVSELWVPTGNDGILFQNSVGTGAVANGDPVGYAGSKGGGVNILQSSAAARPTWAESTGLLTLNGTTQYMTANLPTRASNTYFACSIITTDAQGVLVSSLTGGSADLFAWDSADSTSSAILGATIFVDGAVLGTNKRDALHALIADGSRHVIEVVGKDMTPAQWADIVIGSFKATSFWVAADAGDFVLMKDPGEAARQIIRGILSQR